MVSAKPVLEFETQNEYFFQNGDVLLQWDLNNLSESYNFIVV